MSAGEKMPLAMAQYVAERFLKRLEPYVSVMSIAGSVRRECSHVGDIEIVCVPKDEFSMGIAFPEGFKGMTVNGSRLKRFVYENTSPRIQIELYITTKADYGRILAIRTGSSAFSHHLAVRWGRLGWCGTETGLQRKTECNHGSTWRLKPEYKNCPTSPPAFLTEEMFFNFLGVEYVHPKARCWKSTMEKYNYAL